MRKVVDSNYLQPARRALSSFSFVSFVFVGGVAPSSSGFRPVIVAPASRRRRTDGWFRPATENPAGRSWQTGRQGLSGAFPVFLQTPGGRRKAELHHVIPLGGNPGGDRPAGPSGRLRAALWPRSGHVLSETAGAGRASSPTA